MIYSSLDEGAMITKKKILKVLEDIRVFRRIILQYVISSRTAQKKTKNIIYDLDLNHR